MSVRQVPIVEIAEINPRLPSELAAQPDRHVNFVPMSCLSENGYVESNGTRPLGEVVKGYTYFENADVLVAKITPCMENGKAAFVSDLPHSVSFGSTEFHVLRPGVKVDGRYLFYMVWNSHFRHVAERNMTGTAGQKRVPKGFLERFTIPLPYADDPARSLREQKRIAAILDKADAIRRKRQETCKCGDAFLKSTFLAMFGDPATNPRKLPLRRLCDFYINPKDGTKCGPFGGALKKDEYVSSGVPVWNMDNISDNGKLVPGIRLWISEDKYDELRAYAVQDGDVLISRAGTVGKMCVVRAGLTKSIISTNLIRLRLNASLLPEYFVSLMAYCKGRVGRLKTGPDGAFTHMSTGVLDTLRFPYPSLEEQVAYVDVMDKANHATTHAEDALSDSGCLFKSLVQRAFKGQL